MLKRLITLSATMTLVIALLLPATAMAQDDRGDTDKIVGIFGEVIGIDADTGTITVKFNNGETAVIGADTGFEAGPDWQMGLGDLVIGDRVSAMGRQTADGQYYAESSFLVKPKEPYYHHTTGVVLEEGEGGWQFQDQDGIILGGFDGFGSETDSEGVFHPGGWGFTNGDIVTGVMLAAPLFGENTPAVFQDFRPFSEIIGEIGQNMNQPEGDPLFTGVSLASGIANDLFNVLGTLDDFIPPEIKTQTQEQFRLVLDQNLPDDVWQNLPRDFSPDGHFGALGFIPGKAFGYIPPEAYGDMPDEAFDYIPPEAFNYIPADAANFMAGKGPLADIPTDLVNTDPELFHQLAGEAFDYYGMGILQVPAGYIPGGDDFDINNPPGEGMVPVIGPEGMGWGINFGDPIGPGDEGWIPTELGQPEIWTQNPDGSWTPPDEFTPPEWWDAPQGWELGQTLPDGQTPWQIWTPGMEDGMVMLGPNVMAIGNGSVPLGYIPGGEDFDPNNPPAEGLVPVMGPEGIGWGTNLGPPVSPGDEGWIEEDWLPYLDSGMTYDMMDGSGGGTYVPFPDGTEGLGWTQWPDGSWTPPEGYDDPNYTGGTIPDGQTLWQQEGCSQPGCVDQVLPDNMGDGTMPPGFIPGGDDFDPTNPPADWMVPVIGPDGEMGWGYDLTGADTGPGEYGWMCEDCMMSDGMDMSGMDMGDAFIPPADGGYVPPDGYMPPDIYAPPAE